MQRDYETGTSSVVNSSSSSRGVRAVLQGGGRVSEWYRYRGEGSCVWVKGEKESRSKGRISFTIVTSVITIAVIVGHHSPVGSFGLMSPLSLFIVINLATNTIVTVAIVTS